MSTIDRVEIHGFGFEIENLGLLGQKAQGPALFAASARRAGVINGQQPRSARTRHRADVSKRHAAKKGDHA